jgi:hypothetical protein
VTKIVIVVSIKGIKKRAAACGGNFKNRRKSGFWRRLAGLTCKYAL